MVFQPHILLFLLLVLLLSLNVSCQNSNANITSSTILYPSTNRSYVLSPSGDFAFGFRALDTDPTLFQLLAVYYYKIKAKTVIWTANEGNPVSNKSKAQLVSSGQLTLQDSSNQQIWSSNIGGASYGFMQDNGNFVLSSGSSVVWQTFDSPTDTILPGQILSQDTTIYAKLTEDDYSMGRFKLTLQTDGNLVLYAVGFPTTIQYNSYYSTNTDGNPGNNRLLFNETGSLYLLFSNASIVPLLSKPVVTGDNYMRATLDPDGGFRQYTLSKTQSSTGIWSVTGKLIQDLCSITFNLGSGICGYC